MKSDHEHPPLEFIKMEFRGPRGWKKEDFEKPSRAVVVAQDDGQTGIVLWYEGAHLDVEINEVGCGIHLEDLGIVDAPTGVSIWEGKYIVTQHDSIEHGTDFDHEAVGEFRELTKSEWEDFKRGENPLEAE